MEDYLVTIKMLPVFVTSVKKLRMRGSLEYPKLVPRWTRDPESTIGRWFQEEKGAIKIRSMLDVIICPAKA